MECFFEKYNKTTQLNLFHPFSFTKKKTDMKKEFSPFIVYYTNITIKDFCNSMFIFTK